MPHRTWSIFFEQQYDGESLFSIGRPVLQGLGVTTAQEIQWLAFLILNFLLYLLSVSCVIISMPELIRSVHEDVCGEGSLNMRQFHWYPQVSFEISKCGLVCCAPRNPMQLYPSMPLSFFLACIYAHSYKAIRRCDILWKSWIQLAIGQQQRRNRHSSFAILLK